ncbi:hypothetical protein [Agaribacter marinus]|uniref:Uncharacterized protein n=1 Tax=Agaribacter marinus TaxID=1431249 RepID=A0AA37WK62_9ALTE|nr:hypothetical protein [Agaribacter marinus]GLR70640.1 hypothetical protein GCM10007852_15480 [Agaribacter marinus]
MALSQHQKATLQAMGIDLYASIDKHPFFSKPWVNDLLSLLNISEDDCLIEDIEHAEFNAQTQQLHVPSSLNLEDALLKRQLWASCKNYISPFENV